HGTHGLPATPAEKPISGWPLFFPWARGFARLPLSFPPLAMRGVTRREDALSGSRRTARTITPGGPGSPDPGASADAPRQLGAPRGIYRFRVHGQSDRPAVLVPREGSPPPPGDVTCVCHARGCRVSSHFTTPHQSARQVDETVLILIGIISVSSSYHPM